MGTVPIFLIWTPVFIGHAALALAAKPLAPRANLGVALAATYWLDLSLSRPFIIGNRQQVTLRLDAFNLTDQQRPISIIEEDTEDFGETFARQSPRAFQFGLQYKF